MPWIEDNRRRQRLKSQCMLLGWNNGHWGKHCPQKLSPDSVLAYNTLARYTIHHSNTKVCAMRTHELGFHQACASKLKRERESKVARTHRRGCSTKARGWGKRSDRCPFWPRPTPNEGLLTDRDRATRKGEKVHIAAIWEQYSINIQDYYNNPCIFIHIDK